MGSGRSIEGAVSGDINADVKDGMPHLSGQLRSTNSISNRWRQWCLAKQRSKAAALHWSEAPFQPEVTAPFSADLDIAARRLPPGRGHAYDAGLSLKLDEEGLRLSDLTAKLFGGEVNRLFEIKNNGGTGSVPAR